MKEESQPPNTPGLIIMLLENDIKLNKLVYGLYNMHLVADEYLSDLNVSVLTMMGFTDEQKDKALHNAYNNFIISLLDINIFEKPSKVKELAIELYEILLKEKQLRDKADNLN